VDAANRAALQASLGLIEAAGGFGAAFGDELGRTAPGLAFPRLPAAAVLDQLPAALCDAEGAARSGGAARRGAEPAGAMLTALFAAAVPQSLSDAEVDAVGAALLVTLRRLLGPRFDEQTEAAWAGRYAELAEALVARRGQGRRGPAFQTR
jgi:hypothetical protein